LRPCPSRLDNEPMELMEPQTVDENAATREEEHAAEIGLRFDDAYWDDAFCAWWDPTLRTCC